MQVDHVLQPLYYENKKTVELGYNVMKGIEYFMSL
jgi:hypothetical protein